MIGAGDAVSKGRRALTARETQILELLARAKSNQEIADELYLSVNSIKTHCRTLYRKIGASNRTEAVVWYHDREEVQRPAPAVDVFAPRSVPEGAPCGSAPCTRLVADLTDAVASATQVGRAQGIVMVDGEVDVDGAVAVLSDRAARDGRDVRAVARDLVDLFDTYDRPLHHDASRRQILDTCVRVRRAARASQSEAQATRARATATRLHAADNRTAARRARERSGPGTPQEGVGG
jgi:DNA-binding CsgD family transcriptional regulator